MVQGIGIIGRARSGKDTVAARLVAQHGFQRMALADPLKDMALDINPVIGAEDGTAGFSPLYLADAVELLGWEAVKDCYPEARRFLQRLGTEGVRKAVGADHWVEALMQRRAARRVVADDLRPVVVPDVRFPNEARRLTAAGFQLWYVDRPGVVGGGHASERLGPTMAGHVLLNDSTIQALHRQVDVLIKGEPRNA
ncbi:MULTISPECIES: deoxynucleotide monophosphate kinase family protein [Streptomyces]|uniref:Adenylate kinase n=2 Tax=Streptomyces TaxID=1883 RepID=A0A1E7LQI7_9ACTN|nr:hypothetical protein [Streptomyces nanshensis]OEV18163.1 hypothetical protein AN221_23775 [Streptomyces nanshensis]